MMRFVISACAVLSVLLTACTPVSEVNRELPSDELIGERPAVEESVQASEEPAGVLSEQTPVPQQVVQAEASPEQVSIPTQATRTGVPFTSQAPYANWDDPVYQDGCEEASLLMAHAWVTGKTTLTAEEANREILAISEFEKETIGTSTDTSVDDTANTMKVFYHHENVEARHDITVEDIVQELASGNLVLVPTNGQLLGNPYYTAPGPERHMLVIIGFNSETSEFIVHDPGTKRGEKFRYPMATVQKAILDYPTGEKVPVSGEPKAMIVVRPK